MVMTRIACRRLGPFRSATASLFKYAFRVISVSKFMSGRLVELGADPERIVYNPYGPRDYFYAIKPDFRKTFLAAGRFTDIKAPYLTILAFKQVLDEFPDASLVMVGDGPLRETCISLARTLGMESSASFPGPLRHERLLPLFAQACCFVQHSVTPSYGDAEGTPVAILEAGAAGLPVVSTRHAGIQDVVVHQKTGLLVEERRGRNGGMHAPFGQERAPLPADGRRREEPHSVQFQHHAPYWSARRDDSPGKN